MVGLVRLELTTSSSRTKRATNCAIARYLSAAILTEDGLAGKTWDGYAEAMTPTTQRIYQIVAKIPRGKVATYSDVARMAGIRSPRVVGNALHKNTDGKAVPCHRVVNAQGRVAPAYGFGGPGKQEAILKREGVTFSRVGNEKHPALVDLSRSHWKTSTKST
jgi:methylated-DNA-protein-cysteine methyltransferase-like protein